MEGSGAGVEPVELTGPVEDTGVGGEELMAFQGGCDDDAVGGVSVEVDKFGSANTDEAGKGQFYESLLQLRRPPGGDIFSKLDTALLLEHRHFPEGNSRDGNLASSQFAVYGLARP